MKLSSDHNTKSEVNELQEIALMDNMESGGIK